MNSWPGEVCKGCFKRNVIGFQVDDLIWAQVVGAAKVLCPSCFDQMAQEANVKYEFLELFPITWSQWLV